MIPDSSGSGAQMMAVNHGICQMLLPAGPGMKLIIPIWLRLEGPAVIIRDFITWVLMHQIQIRINCLQASSVFGIRMMAHIHLHALEDTVEMISIMCIRIVRKLKSMGM